MLDSGPLREPGKRAWQPREMLMLSEYLAKKQLTKNTEMRARLGATHPELLFEDLDSSEMAMLRVYSRWADAIHFGDSEVIIIECKIRAVVGAISQLLLYRRLFLSDPEYSQHHGKKVSIKLVYAIEDPVTTQIAREAGIETERYTPSWLQQYLDILRPRDRRPSLTRL